LRRCQTFQTMVRIKVVHSGPVHVSCEPAMARRVQTLITGRRDLGYVPHASALLQWIKVGIIGEAFCAGFPTIVRRRFGKLRPGSAGLVIAKERTNRGPGINVMHLAESSQEGRAAKTQSTPGARLGKRTPGLVIPGLGDVRWRERCRW